MQLNTYRNTILAFVCFIASGFLLYLHGANNSLYNWIISGNEKNISTIAVYNDLDITKKYNKNFNVYRPENFKSAWSKEFRIKKVHWIEFLKEYPNVALYNGPGKITLFFFAKDGMLLGQKQFSATELPTWTDLSDIKKISKEYSIFAASGKSNSKNSKRSPLYWPYKAYQSNLKERALSWLGDINAKSSRKKLAAKKLLTLIRRIN